ENQGDDTRAIWKSLPEGTGDVTFEVFDTLPQLCVLSSSLQYGAGKEPRIAWSKNEHMPMELLKEFGPRPTLIPNVRTREGLRMRWFEEHQSNHLGSGGLKNTPHFQEAMIATWNPRAAFNVRSPWENVAGSLPTSGSAGGPWFFGAYTRDLYDQAVSWPEEAPVPSGGVFHGNPFGQPQEGQPKIVLFDVPRTETGIISLGQFQHAQLSDFIWHPSYAVGNSLVDPRLGSSLDRTAAISSSTEGSAKAGFTKDAIGWSNDKQRSDSQDAWAINGRAILQDVPDSDNLVYDLSYEVNRTLWDRYYLSSGTADEKAAFLKNPADQALPNGRMRLAPGTATADDLGDFHQSAAHLMVAGAFNVNSTRTDAWKALLASTRKTAFGGSKGTPFPRVLDPPGKEWTADSSAEDANAWSGYRSLSDEEIDRLATEIVKQVKLRGPLLSMADFVNRRLANDDTGKMGALQAAIENAGLNSAFQNAYPLDNTVSLPDYHHPDNITDPTRLEQTLKPDCKAWGIPGYLTQADVLQVLGPALAARSDTFVVRAYGDAVDPNGSVVARAWCEAVVQRIPEPLKPDSTGLNPKNADEDGDLGRRFTLVSFRWLNKDEL
ncbi:MAG: hypothetical protein JWO82_1107, partial [Akkermansiaceae bacterium]|nr:hypothetical protein [Akkermansiaceae bacterium]